MVMMITTTQKERIITMYCPNCGKKIDGGAKYCASCGARVDPAGVTVDVDGGDPGAANACIPVVQGASDDHASGDVHKEKQAWYNTMPVKILSIVAILVAMVLLWQNNVMRTSLFVFLIYQVVRQMPELLKAN